FGGMAMSHGGMGAVPTDWRRAPAVSEGTGSPWATATSATAVLEAVTFVEALATAVCMHTAATGGPMMITITDIAAGPIPTTTAATTTVGEESAETTAVMRRVKSNSGPIGA